MAQKGQIPTIIKNPEDMIGIIDAAIVDFRRGSQHLKYAQPLIEAGIPTYVDKPFASSSADAKKIVALAKKHKVPITSYSSLRFGASMQQFKKDVRKIGKVKSIVVSGPGSTKDPYDASSSTPCTRWSSCWRFSAMT